jgi:hypothetical protein
LVVAHLAMAMRFNFSSQKIASSQQATMATAMADDCRDPGAVGAVQPGDIGAIFETRGPDR